MVDYFSVVYLFLDLKNIINMCFIIRLLRIKQYKISLYIVYDNMIPTIL